MDRRPDPTGYDGRGAEAFTRAAFYGLYAFLAAEVTVTGMEGCRERRTR